MPESKFNLKPEQPSTVNKTEDTYIKNIQRIWIQEKREGDPEIELHFAFGAHSSPSDVEAIQKRFKECDIYMPELLGWVPQDKEVYGGLANGLTDPKRLIDFFLKMRPDLKKSQEFSFDKAIYNMIHQSGKAITFIDVPHDHKIVQEMNTAVGYWMLKFSMAKNFSEKIELIKEYLNIYAQMGLVRESYMLQGIPQKIREVIDSRPSLKKKQKVKVLISLGASHTMLYFAVKTMTDTNIERSFAVNPYIFDFRSEGIRRIKLTRDKQISRELLAKILLEMDFCKHFSKSMKRQIKEYGSEKTTKKIRSIIESLNEGEIESIYKLEKDGKNFRDAVLETCKRKGIKTIGF